MQKRSWRFAYICQIIYKSYDKIFYTFIMFRTKVELNQPWNQSGTLSSWTISWLYVGEKIWAAIQLFIQKFAFCSPILHLQNCLFQDL